MNSQPDTVDNTLIRFFLILALILSLLFVFSFLISTKSKREDNSVPTQVALNQFPQVTLGAKAVYVYDVRTKTVLFAKNENTRLPLASLTKVMSAIVALDLSPLETTIIVSREALGAEGDSGLSVGEKWTLRNLLDYSFLTSSNDGMRSIALTIGALSKTGVNSEESINNFVGLMNRKASEIGLKNTYFLNETGLDESEVKGGAYGTASDMNKLVEYILASYPESFTATRNNTTTIESLDNRSHIARNTNTMVAEIPGLLASKTGFSNIAGGNLIFVFDPELGRPIIVSILGSTEEGRFADARSMVRAIMKYISNN